MSGPEPIHITLRATERTPGYLRRRDGDVFPLGLLGPAPIMPAAGTRGTLFGVPGVMRPGLIWEMEELPPPPPDHGPQWARELSRKLDEIKTMLTDADARMARDGKPIMKPQLSKPTRMDPETGAVCWCPAKEE